MRFKLFTIVFLFVLSLASCSKKYTPATIERNCTGTYIEIGEQTFAVCNDEILSNFTDNAHIKVRFNKITDCTDYMDEVVCFLYFEHDGFVKITAID